MPLLARRPDPRELALAAALRELDARDREAGMEVADAGLVAADAGADVVDPAGRGLGGQLRVADQGPRHDARVGLARGEDRLGLLGLADPPGDEHRDPHGRLRPGRARRRVAVRPRRRRHDVIGARQRRGGAGDHAHVVHRPVGVERREGRHRLVLAQAVGRDLADRDPQPDDEPGPRRGPSRRQRLAQEPQPAPGSPPYSSVRRFVRGLRNCDGR